MADAHVVSYEQSNPAVLHVEFATACSSHLAPRTTGGFPVPPAAGRVRRHKRGSEEKRWSPTKPCPCIFSAAAGQQPVLHLHGTRTL